MTLAVLGIIILVRMKDSHLPRRHLHMRLNLSLNIGLSPCTKNPNKQQGSKQGDAYIVLQRNTLSHRSIPLTEAES